MKWLGGESSPPFLCWRTAVFAHGNKHPYRMLGIPRFAKRGRLHEKIPLLASSGRRTAPYGGCA